jgi:hypothetical protein
MFCKNNFWFIILSFLFGCSNTGAPDIPVIDIKKTIGSGQILDLADYVDSIHYVKLNTTDENLVAEIESILYEDEIFVLSDDSYKVKIFHEDGTFGQNVGKRGQGPHEYQFCNGVDYLSSSKEILFHAGEKLLFYDKEGNYKREVKLYGQDNQLFYRKILYLNPTLYVADVVSYDIASSKNVFFNDSLQIIKKTPQNNPPDKGGKHFYSPAVENAIMYHFDNQTIHYKPYEDTIFIMDANMNTKAYMAFDYGKYKHSVENNDMRSINVLDIQESSHYVFLQFNARDYAPEPFIIRSKLSERNIQSYVIYGIYSKKTQKLTLLNQSEKGELGFKNNIDGGLPFWPKYITAHGEMVDYYDAAAFIESFQGKQNLPDDVKNILKDLKEDDNPVIAIAKFKK